MSSLSILNYLNLCGYVINVFITFFATPIFSLPAVEDVSAKFQTIITPAGITFAIWSIIFLSQGIFTVMQMLPSYRNFEIVQRGVGHWYFLACISQSLWYFPFALECMTLSVLFMGLIGFSLFNILKEQNLIHKSTLLDYWIFRFPFEIHFAWICTAFLVNINLAVVSAGGEMMTQVICGSATLIILFLSAIFALFGIRNGPNYTIPSVFAWASVRQESCFLYLVSNEKLKYCFNFQFGIALELHNPKSKIVEAFTTLTVSRFKIAAATLCAFIVSLTVAKAFYANRRRLTSPDLNHVVQTEDQNEASPLIDS